MKFNSKFDIDDVVKFKPKFESENLYLVTAITMRPQIGFTYRLIQLGSLASVVHQVLEEDIVKVRESF